MPDARSAQNNAARDVDEICCGDQVAERVEDCRYGFARKDIAREEYAWKNRQERELHSFRLRRSFAGDQDSERERRKKIRQGESKKQNHVAMNGHEENEAHKKENEAKLEEADAQIGKQFAEEKSEGPHRRDEELLECASLFFSDNRKRCEKRGDIQQH